MQTFPTWLESHSNKFDNNLLHHAYLISGRKGVGKSLLANRLAMQVLCHSIEDILCGECHSCKLSDLENHPDFHTLTILPEKKLIGINQIHELRNKLYESAFLGKNKAIILPHLEKISLDGLNAFLKILEEPPENTYFFLVSDFLNQVPMTIQSRCFDIKVNLPDLTECLQWLDGYSKEDSIKALNLTNNLPFIAKELLENNYLSMRKEFIEEISGIIKEGKDITLTSEKWLKEEDSLAIKLEWMSKILSDSIIFNSHNTTSTLTEDTDKMTNYLGRETNINQLYELLTKTNKLWNIFAQGTNLRKDYQLNSLFIDWERNLGISKKI
jgi:DNA polymerase-3 subunit delta'